MTDGRQVMARVLAIYRVCEETEGEWFSAGDISGKTGIPESSLYLYLNQMVEEGDLTRGSKVYRLSDAMLAHLSKIGLRVTSKLYREREQKGEV